MAAHYLPVPDSSNVELTALLKEIGGFDPDKNGQLETCRKHAWCARQTKDCMFDGRWISGLLPRSRMLPADWAEFARFQRSGTQWVAFRDDHGRRAFALPLSNCSPDSPWVKADSMSAAAWLSAENYRSKVLRWWLEYGCRDDYGCNLDTTSAWALMHYHSARSAQPRSPISAVLNLARR